MLDLMSRFQPDYKIIRILRDFKVGAMDELVKFFDVTLVQNIDSIRLITSNKKKVVSRMGGTRTFNINPTTPFDDELKQVGAIIATNQKLFNIGIKNNKNVFLIPNGIDLEVFKPKSNYKQSCNGDNKPFTVGFVGNICGRMCMDYKGYRHFVQATQRMYTEIVVKMLLFRHNQIPHEHMPEKFYHKIDCLVSLSIDEGCSNVIMEALACGVPVIITEVGFHGERLDNKTNCIFVKRDIDDIINKIRLLKENSELRSKLAFEGRIFAELHHDINTMVEMYSNIFKEILISNDKE